MKNIKKQLFKNWKIITSIGLLFVIALGVLGYIALAPLQGDKAVNAIKYEYDNGIIFSGNGLVNKDQFKNFVRDLNYQFIQTKFDIFKPTYSLIRAQYYPKDNLQDSQKVHNVISIYLERKGILDWKVIDTKDSAITGLSFSDTVSLASKYDLTTDFPGKDKYKITNYRPLTPEEIESNRKFREQDIEDAQIRANNLKRNEAFNALPKAEKITTLETKIKTLNELQLCYQKTVGDLEARLIALGKILETDKEAAAESTKFYPIYLEYKAGAGLECISSNGEKRTINESGFNGLGQEIVEVQTQLDSIKGE